MAKNSPDLPLQPLRDLLAWLRKAKTKGLIIGGLAVAFRGRPRTTRDVDMIIFLPEERCEWFLKVGREYSFRPRIRNAVQYARETRVLLVRHQESGIDVDFSLGGLDFERAALERAGKVRAGRLLVPVASAEDLVVMKAIAGRPKDMIDVQGILDASPDLDHGYIRKHLGQFAEMLDASDLLSQIDPLLLKHKKAARKRK